tara:strand:+ start:83 stop:277 length:195 start_codon:yes stop_codon:yes gene_type:complete
MIEIKILCFDKTIKKGKIVMKFAKEAPAPSNTNRAGSAQHINVEDDANNATRLGKFSFILIITN